MFRPSLHRACAALLLACLILASPVAPVFLTSAWPVQASDGCYSIPVTSYSPTGIAGCVRFGSGIASYYGAGSGVAMNFCTWTWRHTHGCGAVLITSAQTGRQVVAPVVDFCDCYTGTSQERIIDLQTGVLAPLGLSTSGGLYPVTVEPTQLVPRPASKPVPRPTPQPTPTPYLAPPVPHQAYDSFDDVADLYPDSLSQASAQHQLIVLGSVFAKCVTPSLVWERIWVQTSGWTVLVLCDHL